LDIGYWLLNFAAVLTILLYLNCFAASLGFPVGLAVDSAGNVFFGDAALHTIRRVRGATPTDIIADAVSTGLLNPFCLYSDKKNPNVVFVSDFSNHKIKQVSVVSPFAVSVYLGFPVHSAAGESDGPIATAFIHSPLGVWGPSDGNSLYWCEFHTHRVRKYTAATGQVVTVAGVHVNGVYGFNKPDGVNWMGTFNGDGPALTTWLNYPVSCVEDCTSPFRLFCLRSSCSRGFSEVRKKEKSPQKIQGKKVKLGLFSPSSVEIFSFFGQPKCTSQCTHTDTQ